MDILKQFYEEPAKREAVKVFLIECLKEMAVETVFSKKAISGIYEARKVIDKAFDELENMYEPKDKVTINSSR